LVEPFLLLQFVCDGQNARVGISLRQFEEMKERVGGKTRKVSAVFVSMPAQNVLHGIILGIDPSLRGTGYGIIRTGTRGAQPTTLAQGTIACPKEWQRSRCLAKISQMLRDLLLELHH